MQVIEALFIAAEEPRDYLHINHVRALPTSTNAARMAARSRG
jgi:hypothetical protein